MMIRRHQTRHAQSLKSTLRLQRVARSRFDVSLAAHDLSRMNESTDTEMRDAADSREDGTTEAEGAEITKDVTGGHGGDDGMDYLVPSGSGEGNSEFGDDTYD